jgi:uncharacterized protein DUF4157
METQTAQRKHTPAVSPRRKPRGRLYEGQHANVQSILHGNRIQPKLRVGQPNDKYEQEADRVAEQVMRMPAPQPPQSFSSVGAPPPGNSNSHSGTIQRACAACSGEYKAAENEKRSVDPANLCPKCQTQEKGLIQTKQVNPLVQAKKADGVTPEVTAEIGAGIQSLQGGGQPLAKSERSFFESRFTADFSDVRVHSDTRAASLARSVNARAFTHGRNVVFGAGEYSSGSLGGRRLLAHELVHVQQQGGGPTLFSKLKGKETFESMPRIQRQIAGMGASADPIHDQIIKDYRRDQGLPPGGVDPETGQQVGPTDADIKYGALWMNKSPKTNVSLGIVGPSTVDHYCAKYVPSDAKKCGTYPAPNITLAATGVTKGTSLVWRVTKGKGKVKIIGSATKPKVTISGEKKSKPQNDVTIQVTAGKNTATHQLSVLEPTSMSSVAKNPKTTSTVVATHLHYTVNDQFNNPMGAGICIDETIVECDSPFKPGVLKYGFQDHPTDKNGGAVDNIFVANASGIPSGFCVKLDQDITAGGCGPILRNIIVIQSTGITVTKGDCKANSGTCP